MDQAEAKVVKQHLIDPEICIRCNTCEATCPIGAITHDANNYVVDANICNWCMDCIAPCPTGSIDNYRSVPRARTYSVAEQLEWAELPAELSRQELAQASAEEQSLDAMPDQPSGQIGKLDQGLHEPEPGLVEMAASVGARVGAQVPPWSAAHPYTNLYGPKSPHHTIVATVSGNVRVTQAGTEYDTHHLVLDFGSTPFPVLEGQSIGILAPGQDVHGRPHHARMYSIASPRDGERAGYNNVSLTVKRVLEDHQGNPVRGVASNYLCDLTVGEEVRVIGPFGTTFLMPNHPKTHLVMICTGTGSAPMRAMTERRRRVRAAGNFEGGKLMLFFGARTQQELPYFGPLQKLPKEFIDINLALSRTPGQPKTYVQDKMRERAADLAQLLADPESYFYVCGLKSMEAGVILALQDIAKHGGLDWETIAPVLKRDGRLHFETY